MQHEDAGVPKLDAAGARKEIDRMLDEATGGKDQIASGRQRRAAALAEEYKARQQNLYDRISQESLEESIGLLRKEEIWMPLGQQASGLDTAGWQKRLLQDPRIAKIVATAAKGTDDERRRILDASSAELASYLDACGKAQSDLAAPSQEPALRSGLAYPMILAQADKTGESLPLLVRMYDTERARVETLQQRLVEQGIEKGDPKRAGVWTDSMGLSAAAAGAILNRVLPSGSSERRSLGAFQEMPRGRYLLPDLTIQQSQAVIALARMYAERRES